MLFNSCLDCLGNRKDTKTGFLCFTVLLQEIDNDGSSVLTLPELKDSSSL